jgi:hypothetical protein
MVKNQVEYNESIWATRDAHREKRLEMKLKWQAIKLGYQLVPMKQNTAQRTKKLTHRKSSWKGPSDNTVVIFLEKQLHSAASFVFTYLGRRADSTSTITAFRLSGIGFRTSSSNGSREQAQWL